MLQKLKYLVRSVVKPVLLPSFLVLFSLAQIPAAFADQWIALRANDGTWVRAGVGEGTFLASGSPHIKSWETFKWIKLGDGKFAFQSKQNNKYVRAGVGQQSWLAAVSPHIKGWETFRQVGGDGKAVAIQSVQSGKCVTILDNGILAANKDCSDAPWFHFIAR